MSNENQTNGGHCAFPTSAPGDPGLTKREYFAAMAMQGLLARGWNIHELDEASKYAAKSADKLIESLNMIHLNR